MNFVLHTKHLTTLWQTHVKLLLMLKQKKINNGYGNTLQFNENPDKNETKQKNL